MNAKCFLLALSLIVLGVVAPARAMAQKQPPTVPPTQPSQPEPTTERLFVVYSRSGPDKPWFNGSRYDKEAIAKEDVARLKKAGYEAFYRAEAPDGGPPSKAPAGSFHVYIRSDPSDPWYLTGAYKTRAEADELAGVFRKSGYEVFIR